MAGSTPSRRRALAIALAGIGALGGEIARVAGERIVLGPILDPLLAQPPVQFAHKDRDIDLVGAEGHRRQTDALSLYRAGEDVEAALPRIDPLHRFAILDFTDTDARYAAIGGGLAVFSGDYVGRPVLESPDRDYGRFVYIRAARCLLSGHPSFALCYGHVGSRAVCYLSLMLPVGQRLISIGYPDHEWPRAVRPSSVRPGAASPSRGTSATT